jgi:FlaA1/EpsC-like NDP-sugar epimerase
VKNYFKNKKILVAGGFGLLGTNLMAKLINLKAKVTGSYFTKIKEKKYKHLLLIFPLIIGSKDK